MKRVVAILLTLAMAAVMLAGCGSSGGTSTTTGTYRFVSVVTVPAVTADSSA